MCIKKQHWGIKRNPWCVCVYTSAGKVQRVKEKVINNPAPMSSSDSYVIPRSSAISFSLRLPMCVCVCVCALRHLYPPSSFNLPNRNAHVSSFFFCFVFQPSKKCLFLQPKTPKKVKTNSEIPNSKPNRCDDATRLGRNGQQIGGAAVASSYSCCPPSVVYVQTFVFRFLGFKGQTAVAFIFPLSKWAYGYIIYSKMF